MKKLNYIICSLLFVLSHNIFASGPNDSITVKYFVDGKPASEKTIVLVGQTVKIIVSTSSGYHFAQGQIGNQKVQKMESTSLVFDYKAGRKDLADGISFDAFFTKTPKYDGMTAKSYAGTIIVRTQKEMDKRNAETEAETIARVLREISPPGDNSGRGFIKEHESSGNSGNSNGSKARSR